MNIQTKKNIKTILTQRATGYWMRSQWRFFQGYDNNFNIFALRLSWKSPTVFTLSFFMAGIGIVIRFGKWGE